MTDRRDSPELPVPSGQTESVPVYDLRVLLGEIIHGKIMEIASREGRKPLMDEHLEYVGYHGCTSLCRVRVFDPTVRRQRGNRPLVVVFTELMSNPGTSITNRIEHLATLLYTRLNNPALVPVFVEHYPNRGTYCKRLNQWQIPKSFSFVGFRRLENGRFYSPQWQYTTRLTVEVIAGQSLAD